jgi:MoaA/NifB/PqqE/SkfB family radical SAM enzyme
MESNYIVFGINTSMDLTELWNTVHPHLKPITPHLPLEYDECPHCSAKAAISVLANIECDNNYWLNDIAVLICTCCEHVLLLKSEYERLIQQYQFDTQINKITNLNAKLWSDQPKLLNLEPTTYCNFNCWYCVGRSMKQAHIDEKSYYQLLAKSASEIEFLAIVGEGEPFIHKGFFRMVEAAKQKSIYVMTISNGSTLTKSMVSKICESGVNYISISIDSIDPEEFSQNRVDGKLEQVIAGIKRLITYRDEHGFKYPRVGIKGSLVSPKSGTLLNVARTAKKIGVEVFEGFQPLNPKANYVAIYPEHTHNLIDKIKECKDIISEETKQVFEETGLTDIYTFCEGEGVKFIQPGRINRIRKNCEERYIYSLLSGEITPCCQIKQPISKTLNLFDTPLHELYKNPLYENIKFNLLNGIFPKYYCEGCIKTF